MSHYHHVFSRSLALSKFSIDSHLTKSGSHHLRKIDSIDSNRLQTSIITVRDHLAISKCRKFYPSSSSQDRYSSPSLCSFCTRIECTDISIIIIASLKCTMTLVSGITIRLMIFKGKLATWRRVSVNRSPMIQRNAMNLSPLPMERSATVDARQWIPSCGHPKASTNLPICPGCLDTRTNSPRLDRALSARIHSANSKNFHSFLIPFLQLLKPQRW